LLRYAQENYSHFNSIYGLDDKLYILAHNVTDKTGKKSQLYVCDTHYNVVNIIDTNYGNAHNIYINDDVQLICNSGANQLVDLKNDKVLFQCNNFTRGLAVSHDYILVGGSTLSKNRKERYNCGYVYILDTSYTLVSRIKIPGIQINEIRRLNSPDYGMSNTIKPSIGVER